MADQVIRNSPPKAEDMAPAMNMKFDKDGAQAGINTGNKWLKDNNLDRFPLAEPNAVIATMLLHIGDKTGYEKFKTAMLKCDDCTETLWLNLRRNYANWLYRKNQFDKAEKIMADKGFKSPNRPDDEKFADELIRYVGRLLNHDMRAAGMLENLFRRAYDAKLGNTTYLHNMCWWASFSVYAVGRSKDANALALMLTATGDKADPVMGPEPSHVRVARLKLLMSLRFMPLQWAAARYAISKYRLK